MLIPAKGWGWRVLSKDLGQHWPHSRAPIPREERRWAASTAGDGGTDPAAQMRTDQPPAGVPGETSQAR